MPFTKVEVEMIKLNLNRSSTTIKKQIGKKHSLKSIRDKKYKLRLKIYGKN